MGIPKRSLGTSTSRPTSAASDLTTEAEIVSGLRLTGYGAAMKRTSEEWLARMRSLSENNTATLR